MDRLRMEYSFQEDPQEKYLSVRVLDESLKGINASYLLAETGESVLGSSAARIHYDFSKIKFFSSSCIGAIVNISDKARMSGKNIRFRFGSEVMETIKASGIDKVIPLEDLQDSDGKE